MRCACRHGLDQLGALQVQRQRVFGAPAPKAGRPSAIARRCKHAHTKRATLPALCMCSFPATRNRPIQPLRTYFGVAVPLGKISLERFPCFFRVFSQCYLYCRQ